MPKAPLASLARRLTLASAAALALALSATASDGGRLIGVVRVMPDGEIARLAVAPDRHGQGRGTRLLTAAIEHGGTYLFTGDRSAANLRLYERHGFVETHREPVPGHELVYLTRPGA